MWARPDASGTFAIEKRGRVDGIVVEMEKHALRLADAVEHAARHPAAAQPALG